MKHYTFGFSFKGFLAFMLVMIPNIIWMAAGPVNDILAGNNAENPMLALVLNGSQWFMAALLILLKNKAENREKSVVLFLAAALCLGGYYVLWICYFAGIINPWFLVSMAVLPSMYFIFVECWMKNYIAIIPSVIFGITHTVITCSNYLSY